MTSLPCPLPGRVVFPDLAPVPSVVAANPLGLSPETAASPDLSYSQPYGHLLSYSYLGQQLQETPTCSASNSRRCHLSPSTGQLNILRNSKQVSVDAEARLTSGV